MARPKEFDPVEALDGAIAVFREHGFEGTSAGMLVDAMGIGRQSLYDTFGDKWGLYCAAVRRYTDLETQAHIACLRDGARAIDGIKAMVDRVVNDRHEACLGVTAVCEFGRSRRDLSKVHDTAYRALHAAVAAALEAARRQRDIASDLNTEEAAGFLLASMVSIRVARRGGATKLQLRALGELTMRALR
jgi:AcrR family transcriptional regulator